MTENMPKATRMKQPTGTTNAPDRIYDFGPVPKAIQFHEGMEDVNHRPSNVLAYGPRMTKEHAARFGVYGPAKEILGGIHPYEETQYGHDPEEEPEEVEETKIESEEHVIVQYLINIINKLVDILAGR